MNTTEVLALLSGHVEEEPLVRSEHLAAENEILKSRINGVLRLANSERIRLHISPSEWDVSDTARTAAYDLRRCSESAIPLLFASHSPYQGSAREPGL